MEFLKYPCSADKIEETIKENLIVFYMERRNNPLGVVTPVKIKNLVKFYENEKVDYKFNLMDVASGVYLTKEGIRRTWTLNTTLRCGTIKIPIYNNNLKVCPKCGEKTCKKNQVICHTCAIKEKKQYFLRKQSHQGSVPPCFKGHQLDLHYQTQVY